MRDMRLLKPQPVVRGLSEYLVMARGSTLLFYASSGYLQKDEMVCALMHSKHLTSETLSYEPRIGTYLASKCYKTPQTQRKWHVK